MTVDEMHKDRNDARRRRGWAHRNLGGLQTREWFLPDVRYTLIAAADIRGFIASACHTVQQDELPDEGGGGYYGWGLFPILGKGILSSHAR